MGFEGLDDMNDIPEEIRNMKPEQIHEELAKLAKEVVDGIIAARESVERDGFLMENAFPNEQVQRYTSGLIYSEMQGHEKWGNLLAGMPVMFPILTHMISSALMTGMLFGYNKGLMRAKLETLDIPDIDL